MIAISYIMRLFSYLIFTLALSLPVTGTAADTNQHNYATDEYRPTAEQMIIDGLIYRPLTLAGTIVGTGIFIVTLPFSLPGGNADDVGNRLVVEPARATFGRCLGCISDYTGSRAR